MCVHERIKCRRNELNMSVDELANKLNKNRATIYRYEKGDIENLPLDILEPLANALETTPQYLMGWDSPRIFELKVMDGDGTEVTYMTQRESDMDHIERWYKEFGTDTFTEEEYEKIIEFAKFLLHRRDKS